MNLYTYKPQKLKFVTDQYNNYNFNTYFARELVKSK